MSIQDKTQIDVPVLPAETFTLTGSPAEAIRDLAIWRVNYQYAGADYGLRAAVLIIPAKTITEAKALAAATIFDKTGGRWSNITKIVNLTEVPF